MKLGIILGTRPEVIKMSSIIALCEEKNISYKIVHTNQHYSENMDKIFFKELELPDAHYNLNIGSGSHGAQTGKMLEELEKVIEKEKFDIVLVEGDTNTVLAGALAAAKLNVKIGHVEAGLRSFDRTMPEEINRLAVDHISDFLFAPTERSKEYLLKEGIPKEKIWVTGNTVVDAVYRNLEIAKKKSTVLTDLGLTKDGYFLATLHRPRNVDTKEQLSELIEGFKAIINTYKLPVVFPAHPRCKKNLEEFGIALTDDIHIIDPVGYLDFLILQQNARLIMTDSGGVQEEACTLQTPCVTIRENTERPETLDVKANILAGLSVEGIEQAVKAMISQKRDWSNPYGSGNSGLTIVDILQGI